MESYRQRIVLLLVICAFLLSPLAEDWVPSASAALSGTIDFSQAEIPSHYEDAGTVVAMDNFELWHHSGGYWSNQIHGLVIQDNDLKYEFTANSICTVTEQRRKTHKNE